MSSSQIPGPSSKKTGSSSRLPAPTSTGSITKIATTRVTKTGSKSNLNAGVNIKATSIRPAAAGPSKVPSRTLKPPSTTVCPATRTLKPPSTTVCPATRTLKQPSTTVCPAAGSSKIPSVSSKLVCPAAGPSRATPAAATRIRMGGNAAGPSTGKQITKVKMTGTGLKPLAQGQSQRIAAPCTGPCSSSSGQSTEREEIGNIPLIPAGRYAIPLQGAPDRLLDSPQKKLRQKLQRLTPASLQQWKVSSDYPGLVNPKKAKEVYPEIMSGFFEVPYVLKEYNMDENNPLLEQRLDPSLLPEDWSISLREAMSLESGTYEQENPETGQMEQYVIEDANIQLEVDAQSPLPGRKSPSPTCSPQEASQPIVPSTDHQVEERTRSPIKMQSPVGEIDAQETIYMQREMIASPKNTTMDTRITGTKLISPEKAKEIEIIKHDILPPQYFRSSPRNLPPAAAQVSPYQSPPSGYQEVAAPCPGSSRRTPSPPPRPAPPCGTQAYRSPQTRVPSPYTSLVSPYVSPTVRGQSPFQRPYSYSSSPPCASSTVRSPSPIQRASPYSSPSSKGLTPPPCASSTARSPSPIQRASPYSSPSTRGRTPPPCAPPSARSPSPIQRASPYSTPSARGLTPPPCAPPAARSLSSIQRASPYSTPSARGLTPPPCASSTARSPSPIQRASPYSSPSTRGRTPPPCAPPSARSPSPIQRASPYSTPSARGLTPPPCAPPAARSLSPIQRASPYSTPSARGLTPPPCAQPSARSLSPIQRASPYSTPSSRGLTPPPCAQPSARSLSPIQRASPYSTPSSRGLTPSPCAPPTARSPSPIQRASPYSSPSSRGVTPPPRALPPRPSAPCASPRQRTPPYFPPKQSSPAPCLSPSAISRSPIRTPSRRVPLSPASTPSTCGSPCVKLDDTLADVPACPEDATAESVRRLIEEENQDVTVSQELSPKLASKLSKLKKKPQSLRLLDETLDQSLPDEDGERMNSDVVAELLYSQETGQIDPKSSPRKTYQQLFPTLFDEPSIAVSPAPAPLQDIVVPVGEADLDAVALVNEEISEAAATADGDEEIPQGDAYAESVAKNQEAEEGGAEDKPAQESRPLQQLKKPLDPDDAAYLRGVLQEQKAPWDLDLDSLENLVGGQLSAMLSDERLPSDESVRATAGRLEYVLDVQQPLHYSCVQLRGSQHPVWFPGYYSVLPYVDGFVKLEKSPSRAFAAAWQIFEPQKVSANSEVCIQ